MTDFKTNEVIHVHGVKIVDGEFIPIVMTGTVVCQNSDGLLSIQMKKGEIENVDIYSIYKCPNHAEQAIQDAKPK